MSSNSVYPTVANLVNPHAVCVRALARINNLLSLLLVWTTTSSANKQDNSDGDVLLPTADSLVAQRQKEKNVLCVDGQGGQSSRRRCISGVSRNSSGTVTFSSALWSRLCTGRFSFGVDDVPALVPRVRPDRCMHVQKPFSRRPSASTSRALLRAFSLLSWYRDGRRPRQLAKVFTSLNIALFPCVRVRGRGEATA